MTDSDYYQTLGVSKTASADEVRKAYRKLAKEYHPDAKPDDEAAANKFREIQDAYGVLGDKEKRQQFDQFGSAAFGGGRGPFQGHDRRGGGRPVDLNDIFGGQFGGGGGGQFGFGDIFGSQGFGGQGGPQASRKGEDILVDADIPFHVAAVGGNHSLQIRRDGKAERLNVKIRPGVSTGSVIRLAGQGQPGQGSGPTGDLKMTVKVAPHPYFHRDGRSLLIDVPITPSEAALGAKVDVPTLADGNVAVTIPPGTSSGAKLRLRGKGIADLKTGEPGDQFIVVKVVVPAELSEDETRLYQELADSETKSPRNELWK